MLRDKLANAIIKSVSIKLGAYSRPYGLDMLPEHLRNDPVHRWRAENGVELLHEEPTYAEFKRILRNWKDMPEDLKLLSDEESVRLFGVDNMTNAKKLRRLMREKTALIL